MARARTLMLAIAAVAIFQIFLRYYYVHAYGGVMYRVDRLTQHICMAAPRNLCEGNGSSVARQPDPIVAPTVLPQVAAPVAPSSDAKPYDAAIDAARKSAVEATAAPNPYLEGATPPSSERNPYLEAVRSEQNKAGLKRNPLLDTPAPKST